MHMFKRLTAFMSAALTAAAIPTVTTTNASAADKSAQQIIDEMGIGWNLGNTFESWGDLWWVEGGKDNYETGWGSPKITKELIEFVHSSGFSSIRIPVSWHDHMSGSDFTIDKNWMNRVKEVVDYAYNDGMYVIINIHHDNTINDSGKFFYPSSQYKDRSEKYVKDVWSQISETFKDYDEHLIFETLNEPRLTADPSNEWWFDVNSPNNAVSSAISIINTLNQDAVDVIRASGGNNAKRLIMCPGYDASVDGAMTAGYKLPSDSANMTAVSIHAYTPYDFALNTTGTSTYSDPYNELDWLFGSVKKLKDSGKNVIIGEFGALDKDNSAERVKWAEYYTSKTKELGVSLLVWDNDVYYPPENADTECFGLIKRSSLAVSDLAYLNALTKNYPLTPVSKRVPGDANNDGEVTVADVLLIQQYLAKWSVTINKENSDVNGDGEVTVADVLLIQQKLAKWNVTLV